MKTFYDYLEEESSKKYEFKIKVAYCPAEDEPSPVADRIEHALKSYSISYASKPTVLPIGAGNLDFPNINGVDVCVMDVILDDPCNDALVRKAIIDLGRFAGNQVIVIPAGSPEEEHREEDNITESGNLGDFAPPAPPTKVVQEQELASKLYGVGFFKAVLKEIIEPSTKFDTSSGAWVKDKIGKDPLDQTVEDKEDKAGAKSPVGSIKPTGRQSDPK